MSENISEISDAICKKLESLSKPRLLKFAYNELVILTLADKEKYVPFKPNYSYQNPKSKDIVLRHIHLRMDGNRNDVTLFIELNGRKILEMKENAFSLNGIFDVDYLEGLSFPKSSKLDFYFSNSASKKPKIHISIAVGDYGNE